MLPLLLALAMFPASAQAGHSKKPQWGKCWKDADKALLSINDALKTYAPKMLDAASCPQCAEALTPPVEKKPEILDSLEAFRAHYASGWKVSFDDVPELAASGAAGQEKLIAFASQAVFEGLNRLWDVNPDLVQAALARSRLKKAKLSGLKPPKPSKSGVVPMALTDAFSGVIRISPTLLEPLIQPGALEALPTEKIAFRKLVIFHEFLHLLMFDNTAGDEMDHSPEGFAQRLSELHTVEACGNQAFPAGIIFKRDGKFYKNSYLACMTCAGARPYTDGEGTVQICDPREIWYSHQRCQGLPVNGDGLEMTDAEIRALTGQ